MSSEAANAQEIESNFYWLSRSIDFLLHHCISKRTAFWHATACIYSNPAIIFSFFTFTPSEFLLSEPFLTIFYCLQNKRRNENLYRNPIWNGTLCGRSFCVYWPNLISRSINRTNTMPQISPINKYRRWMHNCQDVFQHPNKYTRMIYTTERIQDSQYGVHNTYVTFSA